MQPNLLTENFSSMTIKSHYESSKAQAVAFLMTVGAKALILQDQKPAKAISRVGINDEAELRRRMVAEERIRSIHRRIMSRAALTVWKRGRNEKIRAINMVVNHDRTRGTSINWKSKLNYNKKFEVTVHTKLSRIRVEDTTSIGSGRYKISPRNKKKDGSNKPNSSSFSFLRLKNNSRSLDLSFHSTVEMEAFLVILQKLVGLQIERDIFPTDVTPLATSPTMVTSSTSEGVIGE